MVAASKDRLGSMDQDVNLPATVAKEVSVEVVDVVVLGPSTSAPETTVDLVWNHQMQTRRERQSTDWDQTTLPATETFEPRRHALTAGP